MEEYKQSEQIQKTYDALQKQREKAAKKEAEDAIKVLKDRANKEIEIQKKLLEAQYSDAKEFEEAFLAFKKARQFDLQLEIADAREKLDEKNRKEQAQNELEDRKKAHAQEKRYRQEILKTASRAQAAQIHRNAALEQQADLKKYEANKKRQQFLLKLQQEQGAEFAGSEELKQLTEALQNFESDNNIKGGDTKGVEAEIYTSLIASLAETLNDPNASKEDIEAAQESYKAAQALSTSAEDSEELESKRQALAFKSFENEAKDRENAIKDRNQEAKDRMKYLLTTEKGRTELLKGAAAAMVKKAAAAFDALEQPIHSFYEYQAKYEARMAGAGNEYGKMLSNIGFTVGLSPFISQKKMVENLQKLIETGTDYNLELRAYIATASESIASTFDAFDNELLRLVRIQQNDSTAARLGMESALNRLLNTMFSDTSYLSGTSDTVSDNLLDASAQLTHQAAAEFEFIVQKWLGSLYSVGVSDSAVTNIAQGLGYLGSGNIEALAGNEQLMTLLAMSASKGGSSISDMLTGNLTAENTNKLLKGMVELLREIAGNTESNNVTKSAFASVFGVTNTDLRSITNLTGADINKLYDMSTSLNYNQAIAETSEQLTQIGKRTHISSMISNLIDNATTSSALMVGGNPVSYALYKTLSLVSNMVGEGLTVPGITVLGSGTTSGIKVLDIAKAAFTGTSLMASLLGSLGNLGSGGLPSLERWGGLDQSVSRGTDIEFAYKDVTSGFSKSEAYNSKVNTSGDDVTKASMDTAQNSAIENQSESDKVSESQRKAEEYQETVLERLGLLVAIDENLESIKTTQSDNIKGTLDKIHENLKLPRISVTSLSESVDTPVTNSEDVRNNAWTTITQLQSDSITAAQALKVNVVNDTDPAKIEITKLSNEVQTKLAELIKSMVTSAFIPTDDSDENATNLLEVLKASLDGMNVHVNNDYFDDYYQKQSMMLGGDL